MAVAPTFGKGSNGYFTRSWLIDVAMGLISVVVVLVFLVEPLPVDPMIYLNAAVDPLSAGLNHWTTRLGITLPTWLVSTVFGYSEVTYYAFPTAMAFVFGAAVSALGRQVAGTAMGALATPVALSSPMVLPFATLLLPDVGAAAFIAASAAFFIAASKQSGRRQGLFLILTGLCFGAAYLIRETVLFFGPALPVGAWILRLRVTHVVLVVIGSLVAPTIEIIGGLAIWGDPWARITSLLARNDRIRSVSGGGHPVTLAAQEGFLRSFAIFSSHLWSGWFGRILLIGSALITGLAAWMRQRAWLFLISWTMIPWVLYAMAGAYRPEPGRVVIRLTLDRYWAVLVPSLAVGLVAASIWLFRRLSRSRSGIAYGATCLIVAAAVALGVSASFENRGHWFVRFGNDSYWQLRSALSSVEESANLLVPSRYRDLVELYAHDSLGSRVSSFRIVSQTGGESGEPWLLFLDDVDGPRSTVGSRLAAVPPAAYGVFAAEETSARWILLTPEEDRQDAADLARFGSGSEVEWLGRFVVGNEWRDPFPVPPGPVRIEDGEQLVVFDAAAPFGASPDVWLEVEGESLVEIRVELQMGPGAFRLACHAFPSDGSGRVGLPASSMASVGPIEDEVVGYCPVPEGDNFQVRPVLAFEGPNSVSIGPGALRVHESE